MQQYSAMKRGVLGSETCALTFRVMFKKTNKKMLLLEQGQGGLQMVYFFSLPPSPRCLANQMLDIFRLVCTLMNHVQRVHPSHHSH